MDAKMQQIEEIERERGAFKAEHGYIKAELKQLSDAIVRQVREMLSLGLMGYHHLSGSLNCSDALTKRLESVVFNKHARTILGRDLGRSRPPH